MHSQTKTRPPLRQGNPINIGLRTHNVDTRFLREYDGQQTGEVLNMFDFEGVMMGLYRWDVLPFPCGSESLQHFGTNSHAQFTHLLDYVTPQRVLHGLLYPRCHSVLCRS